jgi:hypothetical protein
MNDFKRFKMINKKYLQLAVITVMFSGNCLLYAQNAKPINVVTTAVPFLRISPDAKAGGMGDIGLATTPDANAGYWNIGKIPFNTLKGGIVANYTPWLKDWASDMFLAAVSGYYKFDETQAINGGIRYFSLGNLQFSDNMGNHLQSFHPGEFGIDFGYSRKLSDKAGVGLGLKYIHSQLATNGAGGNDYKAGNAVAADLGFYYDAKKANGDGWSFGAALSNLGSKISYTENADQKDFIPANLGLGTTYTKVFDEQNKIKIGFDINKLLVPTPPNAGDSAALVSYRDKSVVGSWFSSFDDAPGGFSEELKEFQVSLGAEYWYNDQFAVRAGYFYENKTKGNRRYFSTGLSIKYNVFTLHFSYLLPAGSGVDRSPLSNTLRLGIVFGFDK